MAVFALCEVMVDLDAFAPGLDTAETDAFAGWVFQAFFALGVSLLSSKLEF